MDTSIGTEIFLKIKGYIYKKEQPPPVKMGAAVEYFADICVYTISLVLTLSGVTPEQ